MIKQLDIKKTNAEIAREEKDSEILKSVQGAQSNMDNAICELTLMLSMMIGGV